MKLIGQTLAILSLAASIAHGGDIVKGKSLTFTADDFAGGTTASKLIVINTLDSTSGTEVFDASGMELTHDGRISVAFAGSELEFNVTYKVTTPTSTPITKFTFALNNLTLAGSLGGGNVVKYQYSTDGTNFHDFFSHDNLGSGDVSTSSSGDAPAVTLSNQTYNVTLPSASETLYVRVDEVGNGTSSSYFALWSNDGDKGASPAGGSSPHSYISVTVAKVPAPGAAVQK